VSNLILYVTPEEFGKVKKLSDACSRHWPSESFDDARFQAGMAALLGEDVVQRMKYKRVDIQVDRTKAQHFILRGRLDRCG